MHKIMLHIIGIASMERSGQLPHSLLRFFFSLSLFTKACIFKLDFFFAFDRQLLPQFETTNNTLSYSYPSAG